MKPTTDLRQKLVGGLIGVFAGVAGLATPAISCSLEASADLSGAFSIGHRGSIVIAIATHDAIVAGHIAALPNDNAARFAQLDRVRQRAIAHVQKLTEHTQNNGLPVAVLLTQSGAWMRLNDPDNGAIYHADPAAEGETELLLPDMVYAALLDGKMSVQRAVELGLIRVYGTEDKDQVIASFSNVFEI
jgi:hypothetical protein